MMEHRKDRPKELADLPLGELLLELGFGGRNEALALQALVEAGLTRAGKQRIAADKRERVGQLLRERFVLVCHRAGCARDAGGRGREVVVSERPADCEVCGGSENKVAAERLLQALQAQRVRRLLVVGGSPASHQDLAALLDGRVELRLVDGSARRTKDEARKDLLWADLVIVWGGTQLDHKVSTLYTAGSGAAGASDRRVVVVHRRGIAALVAEFLGKRP